MADKKKAVKKVEMLTDDSDRAKALDMAMAMIKKEHGDGAIMRLGEQPRITEGDVISTGSFSIDDATGIGGVPRGRIVEIYGPESSGKTTLTLHIVAECQKLGGKAAFIDAEHALDPVYAKALGVNVEELLVSQPDSGEQGLEICEILVRSGAIDVVVVDSVAALVPQAEIVGEMGDSHVGLQARLMSQALRKITSAVNRSNTCVIFINQLREKIGNYGMGPSETTSGGRALKFYASMRIDVRKAEAIKQGDSRIGNRTKVKIVKNKLAPPFRETVVDMMYGEGISRFGDMIDNAMEHGIIKKSGSWYSFGAMRIGQGKETARQFLRDNPKVSDEVDAALLEARAKADADKAKKAEKSKQSEAAIADSLQIDELDLQIDDDGVIIE